MTRLSIGCGDKKRMRTPQCCGHSFVPSFVSLVATLSYFLKRNDGGPAYRSYLLEGGGIPLLHIPGSWPEALLHFLTLATDRGSKGGQGTRPHVKTTKELNDY